MNFFLRYLLSSTMYLWKSTFFTILPPYWGPNKMRLQVFQDLYIKVPVYNYFIPCVDN